MLPLLILCMRGPRLHDVISNRFSIVLMARAQDCWECETKDLIVFQLLNNFKYLGKKRHWTGSVLSEKSRCVECSVNASFANHQFGWDKIRHAVLLLDTYSVFTTTRPKWLNPDNVWVQSLLVEVRLVEVKSSFYQPSQTRTILVGLVEVSPVASWENHTIAVFA